MKIALIAPTINEIAALPHVLPKLDKNIIHEIIVVDLNSTDGTVEYCIENGFRVHRQRDPGYGAAFLEAIAITNADVIIEFTPDGSAIPEKVPDLLAKINEGYDLVIASRYKDGAKSYDDDIITHFGNWLFTKFVNILFRAHYTDTLVGFKAYRRSALNRAHLTAKGISWAVQLPIRFTKTGAKVAEIGIDEPARIGGVRKMKPFRSGLEILWMIIKEFLSGKKITDL